MIFTYEAILNDYFPGHSILQQQPSDAELNRIVIPYIASKWRLFARQIGLGGAVLDTIQGNNAGESKTCFNEVIDQWRKSASSSFTWEIVFSVIYSDTVRGYKAGEKVYQYLIHECSVDDVQDHFGKTM